MPDDSMPIARIRLARDMARLLALPVLLLLLAMAGAVGAVVLGGLAGLALAAESAVVAVGALVLILLPLSVRVDVEVGGVRVRSLAGTRRYQLVRGPVTRVALTGSGQGVLHSRYPILGWSNGRAVLRGEEDVTLVRLARTPTVILVPTDHGRLGVAAASEMDLLEALGVAARVQQRLDEVSGRVMAAFHAGIPDLEERRRAARAVAAPPVEEAPEPGDSAEPERFLTGIERARLEERLAAAREAALLAAEAERQAALEAAAGQTSTEGAASAIPARPFGEEAPRTAPSLARQRIRATWTRPAWATDARLRVLVTIGWAAIPLLASIVTWAVTTSSGRVPFDRQLSLALTLGGPAAALGVVTARTWWPRLTGLVASGALVALVIATRAAFG